MILDVIGSSPAWPNPGQAHAGYLVTSTTGERLLLDCGPGVLARLRESDLLPVAAVAITHMHLDHWGDLVPWCWFNRRLSGEAAERPQLWLPPGGLDALAAFVERFGSAQMFERAFAAREFVPGTPFAAAGCKVDAQAVAHYGVPSFGFRVTDDAILSYSGDSAPCDALTELASSADLFLCEATLADASDDGEPRGHLTAAEALAAAAGTRLLLTHRPAELATPEQAPVATAGMRVTL